MTPLGLILTTIAISLFCNGLYLICEDGMILSPVREWLEKRIGQYMIYKPIIGCVTCMASIWGTVVFFTLHDYCLWPYWILCCIGAAFTNTLFIAYLNRLQQ